VQDSLNRGLGLNHDSSMGSSAGFHGAGADAQPKQDFFLKRSGANKNASPTLAGQKSSQLKEFEDPEYYDEI